MKKGRVIVYEDGITCDDLKDVFYYLAQGYCVDVNFGLDDFDDGPNDPEYQEHVADWMERWFEPAVKEKFKGEKAKYFFQHQSPDNPSLLRFLPMKIEKNKQATHLLSATY